MANKIKISEITDVGGVRAKRVSSPGNTDRLFPKLYNRWRYKLGQVDA